MRHWQGVWKSDSVAWLMLAVSLAVTALIWSQVRQSVERLTKERFEVEANNVRRAIGGRIADYAQVMRSASGLFAARDEVSRVAWRQYVKAQQLEEHYPGIQVLGYSEMFDATDKAAHERRIRNEGFPDYVVKPAGERERYSAIIYVEPFTLLNKRAFGYDMYSEPVRHRALDLATESGRVTVSGKVRLLQETNKDVQAGFLMYFPVYRRDQVLNTAEDRRLQLRGFIYSAFRFGDFLANT